jgi:hypothetical protein
MSLPTEAKYSNTCTSKQLACAMQNVPAACCVGRTHASLQKNASLPGRQCAASLSSAPLRSTHARPTLTAAAARDAGGHLYVHLVKTGSKQQAKKMPRLSRASLATVCQCHCKLRWARRLSQQGSPAPWFRAAGRERCQLQAPHPLLGHVEHPNRPRAHHVTLDAQQPLHLAYSHAWSLP